MGLGIDVEGYIRRNDFASLIEALIGKLNKSNHPDVANIIVYINNLNDLYNIMPKYAVYNLYIENKKKILSNSYSYFDSLIFIAPLRIQDFYYQVLQGRQSMQFKSPEISGHSNAMMVGFSPVEYPDYHGVLPSASLTAIQFTVPGTVSMNTARSLKEEISFTFVEVNHFSEHFLYKNKLPIIHVAGNTIGHLFDIYPGQGPVTVVQALLQGEFHPEFTLENSGNELIAKDIDLTEERATYGEDYLPTKARVIRALREVVALNSDKFEIELPQVNMDLFSCLNIILVDAEKKILLERLYLLTSKKIYNAYTEKYIEGLKLLQVFEDEFINNFYDFSINSVSDLHTFANLLFEQVVAHEIRYNSGYKFFWKDDSSSANPKTEPQIQPYIINLIAFLGLIKGVSIEREPMAAEGTVDMLFSYTTKDGKLLRVCVEIKLAHHSHVASAIGTQLKQYLDAKRTKHGIYLVFWLKNVGFNKPAKYDSLDSLKSVIESNAPNGYTVSTIVIDCTRPISPSLMR